jgi:hypothetical protein
MQARSPVLAGLYLKDELSDEPLSGHLGELAQDLARINAIADTFEMLAQPSQLEGFAGDKSFRISEGCPKVFTTKKGGGDLF